jgi:hypothetical protein
VGSTDKTVRIDAGAASVNKVPVARNMLILDEWEAQTSVRVDAGAASVNKVPVASKMLLLDEWEAQTKASGKMQALLL